MASYLAIGHLTLDRLTGGGRPGGTVLYATRQARALGLDARMLTSTDSVTLDLASDLLRQIEVTNVASANPTTFSYSWPGGRRRQKLTHTAADLGLSDLPASWTDSTIWHLAPVANEIGPDILDSIPQSSFLGITPQGWMRRTDTENVVHKRAWFPSDRLLQLADAIVFSRNDIVKFDACAADWSKAGPTVAVTEAGAGVNIWHEGVQAHIPAHRVDPGYELGAGDVFAAAFFVFLSLGLDPTTAGEYANAVAATFVARTSESLPPTPDAVFAATGVTIPRLNGTAGGRGCDVESR